VTTKDAGDAITLLQSLAGSTFDSSQLVLTACMGFQSVREMGLKELRKKHRPEILTAMEERSKNRGSWKDKKGLATKLYSFKHDPSFVCSPVKSKEGLDGSKVNGEIGPANLETYLSTSSILDNDLDQGVDLQDQVTPPVIVFIFWICYFISVNNMKSIIFFLCVQMYYLNSWLKIC